MNHPLTDQLRDEAERYSLRSSCRHCFFFVADDETCAHGWPNEGQKQWPLRPPTAHFCKEFELL